MSDFIASTHDPRAFQQVRLYVALGVIYYHDAFSHYCCIVNYYLIIIDIIVEL